MTAPDTSMLRRRPPEAIPLMLLTGFLGAGKTTLLNQLVREPELARSVVIINEFGDVAIDHLLVEQADGGLLTLSSGCVCCTVRGELVDMLEDLLRRRDNGRMAPFDRVVIETTGLADPGPILNAFAEHPYLGLRYRIDRIVAVVDALHGRATLDAQSEAVDQVAMADVLVLAKTDLADEAALAPLRARLAEINPTAPVRTAAAGDATAARLLSAVISMRHDPTQAAHHDHAHDHGEAGHHHGDMRSVVLRAAHPVQATAVGMFLELLQAEHGSHLLRAKGLVALEDDRDRPLVIQIVQQTLHPLRRLSGWPDEDAGTRLVVIGRTLDVSAVSAMWAAFFDAPAIARPDGAALAERLVGRGPGLF